jgi:F0F1-type ATP synthase assembly protein I
MRISHKLTKTELSLAVLVGIVLGCLTAAFVLMITLPWIIGLMIGY